MANEIKFFGTGKKYYFEDGRYLGWAYSNAPRGEYVDAVPGEAPGEEKDGRDLGPPEVEMWPFGG